MPRQLGYTAWPNALGLADDLARIAGAKLLAAGESFGAGFELRWG